MRSSTPRITPCWAEAASTELENGVRSIAFPCISTGVYGYPRELAANVAITAVRQFLEDHPSAIDATFCCFSSDDYAIYRRLLQA